MFEFILDLIKGIPASLILTVLSLILAFVLATIMTVVLTLKIKGLNLFVEVFLTVFTGTPLLVQFFLIYYGPGQFDWLRNTFLWSYLFSNAWFCAVLTLSLNSAAYTTRLFYGAVKAIPSGQWQACRALGLSKWQQICLLFPYALKRALSSYSNEVVLVFKSTSLAYTVTIMEIMGHAAQLYGNNYNLMVLVEAGLIYLVINGLLTWGLRVIEYHALQFERRH